MGWRREDGSGEARPLWDFSPQTEVKPQPVASPSKAGRPSWDTGSGPVETAGGQGPEWRLTQHLLLLGGPLQTSRPSRETGRQEPVSAPVIRAQGKERSPGPLSEAPRPPRWGPDLLPSGLAGVPVLRRGEAGLTVGLRGDLLWLPWRGAASRWEPSRAGPWPHLSLSLICPCRKPWQKVSRRQSPGRSHNTSPGVPGKAGATGEVWRWRPPLLWTCLWSLRKQARSTGLRQVCPSPS